MWHVILDLECLFCCFVFQIYDGLNHYSPKKLPPYLVFAANTVTEDRIASKSWDVNRDRPDEFLEGCNLLMRWVHYSTVFRLCISCFIQITAFQCLKLPFSTVCAIEFWVWRLLRKSASLCDEAKDNKHTQLMRSMLQSIHKSREMKR